jgi:quinol monooxygenase YgiN
MIDAASGPVVYEVNVEVDRDIADAYRSWLRAHIAEILALPGFVDAQVFAVSEPPPAEDRIGLCVHYRLTDIDALDAYLRDHAPRLRADGVARFGERFRAYRRIMRELSQA